MGNYLIKKMNGDGYHLIKLNYKIFQWKKMINLKYSKNQMV